MIKALTNDASMLCINEFKTIYILWNCIPLSLFQYFRVIFES